MDLSAVIFVAVAVAWAVYLVPKALRHHDEATRSRSVDRFSHTVRVLARRDAVSGRGSRLVISPRERRAATTEPTPVEPASDVVTATPEDRADAPEPATPAQVRARRLSARRATKRRRRVLGVLLAANAIVGTLAVLGVVGAVWPALPGGLLIAWLATCRVMVRGELSAWDAMTGPAEPASRAADAAPLAVPLAESTPVSPGVADEVPAEIRDEPSPGEETTSLASVPAASPLWDPVPVTLPTYVHKNTAVRRSVRTIDLDATGVWTSGRTDEDARIAQAAAKRAAHGSGDDTGEAVVS